MDILESLNKYNENSYIRKHLTEINRTKRIRIMKDEYYDEHNTFIVAAVLDIGNKIIRFYLDGFEKSLMKFDSEKDRCEYICNENTESVYWECVNRMMKGGFIRNE